MILVHSIGLDLMMIRSDSCGSMISSIWLPLWDLICWYFSLLSHLFVARAFRSIGQQILKLNPFVSFKAKSRIFPLRKLTVESPLAQAHSSGWPIDRKIESHERGENPQIALREKARFWLSKGPKKRASGKKWILQWEFSSLMIHNEVSQFLLQATTRIFALDATCSVGEAKSVVLSLSPCSRFFFPIENRNKSLVRLLSVLMSNVQRIQSRLALTLNPNSPGFLHLESIKASHYLISSAAYLAGRVMSRRFNLPTSNVRVRKVRFIFAS